MPLHLPWSTQQQCRGFRSQTQAELMVRWREEEPTPLLIAEPCSITLKTIVTVMSHLLEATLSHGGSTPRSHSTLNPKSTKGLGMLLQPQASSRRRDPLGAWNMSSCRLLHSVERSDTPRFYVLPCPSFPVVLQVGVFLLLLF